MNLCCSWPPLKNVTRGWRGDRRPHHHPGHDPRALTGIPLGVHLHPLLHHKDGSASVHERLFGRLADAPAPAERVLADVHREMSTQLDDVARCCADWYDSPTDETGAVVQADLQRIAGMLTQAARSLPRPDEPLRVILLGRTQAGKSTLFSYLTGSDVSPVGHGAQRFTRSVVEMPMAGRADVVVVDTPGVGALDGDEDRETALDAARQADLVVWVATNNSQPSETASALSQVARWGAPMLLVFNCREDLVDASAVDQFLAYPDSTFAELDGHSTRLARFLDPYGQRPLQVLPVHAAAALLGRRTNPANADLLRESRVDALATAIRAEADRHRHPRRAAAIVDTARRALVDAAEQLTADSDGLVLVADTRQEESADFDRRTARLMADVDLQVQGEIEALLRRFDDWADRNYQRNDGELRDEWDADERHLREDADELLRATDARLRRRLHQLDEEVAAAWSKRLEVKLTKWSRIGAGWLAPRWIDAAGRTAVGAAGSILGMAIGAALGNVPGAAIGAMVGGLVGERVGSLLQIRRSQLARRRSTLHESVGHARVAIRSGIDSDWDQCRESIQQALTEHASARNRAIERTAALARHASLAGESAYAAVASADSCLLRALLRMEGRDRLAEYVTTVHRCPGFAYVVPLTDSAALQEFMLWAPKQVLEQVRPIPDGEEATAFRRAAYALDAGRRRVVLLPDGDGIRAVIPDQLSTEFLAAEAALVSNVIDVPLDLRSAPTRLMEVVT
jgi:small GTP-binding protein